MTRSKFSLWNSGWDRRITLSIKLNMVPFLCERMLGVEVQKPPRKSWFAKPIMIQTIVPFDYGKIQKIQLLAPHLHGKIYSRMKGIELIKKLLKTGERSRKGDIINVSIIKISLTDKLLMIWNSSFWSTKSATIGESGEPIGASKICL